MNAKLLGAMVVTALGLALAACVTPVCAGTNCDCPTGQTCAFTGCDSSTANCQYHCGETASCTGSCGANCNVQCSGKDCTHTVGAGSRVQCSSGTCKITCNGACLVQGATQLTCSGGTTESPAGCN